MYPVKTAGAVMATRFVAVTVDYTVAATLQEVTGMAATEATIDYVYLINTEGFLVGVVSLRELLCAPSGDSVATIAQSKVSSVTVLEDQEHIVHLAAAEGIKAVPVVTENKVLVGVVTTDEILRIINQEIQEDILHFSGTTPKENLLIPQVEQYVRPQILQRLPWLLVGLGGGTLAAFVVGYFEVLLAEYVILAAFIPLIVYLADAVGMQIQLIFIRRLTIDPKIAVGRYFRQEVQITFVIALVLSLIMAGVTSWWIGDQALVAVLSLAVLITTLAAMVIAVLLPWLFVKTGRDPAVASGPFGTVIIDILSLLIYFTVASVMLGI